MTVHIINVMWPYYTEIYLNIHSPNTFCPRFSCNRASCKHKKKSINEPQKHGWIYPLAFLRIILLEWVKMCTVNDNKKKKYKTLATFCYRDYRIRAHVDQLNMGTHYINKHTLTHPHVQESKRSSNALTDWYRLICLSSMSVYVCLALRGQCQATQSYTFWTDRAGLRYVFSDNTLGKTLFNRFLIKLKVVQTCLNGRTITTLIYFLQHFLTDRRETKGHKPYPDFDTAWQRNFIRSVSIVYLDHT